MSLQIIELTYPHNSADLFSCIADLPWAAYLDSCQPTAQQGRYDILTALPYISLRTMGKTTEIHEGGGTKISDADPFELLKKYLMMSTQTGATNHTTTLPFTGGALGYFSYDLARRLERIPTLALADAALPEMAVGIYDWMIIVDHKLQTACLVTHHTDPNTATILPNILNRIKQPSSAPTSSFRLTGTFTSNLSKPEYKNAFEKIQNYIQAGDCYQVNLSQRFSTTFEGSPWNAYQQLRHASPVPYAAYLHYPNASILSLSPERFLQVSNQRVETKPIKGTRPRGITPEQDLLLAEELSLSPKDRAENVMIVDLLRNDLGKSCRYGSVKVPSLFTIESFPNVHHLVSTITGELAAEKCSLDLLRDCFPGGSITGAPKIRAMEIIEELEPHRRGIYCGSIGYIDFNGNMDINIAIRTLTCMDSRIFCSAGGALVADSECEAEYQETLIKVERLLKKLST